MPWSGELAYLIKPKSGPVRVMHTLLDANRALMDDLAPQTRRRAHWQYAGWLLIKAAQTGNSDDVVAATDSLVDALDIEGWMTATHARNVPPNPTRLQSEL